MIGWEDVYKVVVAMAPLYVALILGYASVKWWRIFTHNQCDAINHLVCYFTLPLFTFEFTAHVDPFEMNYKFLGADAISKVIIVVVLAFWAKCSTEGSYRWSITSFSLSTLTNSLVVGVPLMKAMYGEEAVHLVVQGSVTQAIVWLTILLFVLEVRRTRTDFSLDSPIGDKNNIVLEENNGSDLEGNNAKVVASITRPSFWCLTRKVWLKLATNPNSYACIFGLTWALVSNRDVHGIARESDSMWCNSNCVWNGFEIHSWTSSYGYCLHCYWFAWGCLACRHNPGMYFFLY
ncbi:auxin efflux carrier component 5-like isoform X2 [Lycium ferocissimum]|uniref:auxin efflux carrier component 5-like isoform X2 n=1 Tax=Lycium ferocissimum TaxID=112874 RepID=UPI002815DE91|nr:auxin efflux carrier component 5-like isoform X2 [Lycium ferocissimum]